jgi:hypothetical protein
MKRIGSLGSGIVGKPEAGFRTCSDEIDVRLKAGTIAP